MLSPPDYAPNIGTIDALCTILLGGVMEEVWKPILGYEGVYSVSNLGRVRREAYIMKGGKTVDGYPQHKLSNKGKIKTIQVHKLVALAFIGPKPSPTHEVNHKNGIKTENIVTVPYNNNDTRTNLEYTTPQRNKQHAKELGLYKKAIGENNGGGKKLKEEQVVEIKRLLATKKSDNSIAELFGVCQATIWRIRKRIIWKHIPDA